METSVLCEGCLLLEYISWYKKDLIYQSYGIALFLSWPKVVVRYNLDFISTFGLLSLHTGNARYVAGVVVVPK